jgi:hypothetical protein
MTSDITNNDPVGPPETSTAAPVEDLLQRIDALPTVDSRPEHEILGYDDEDGVPR